jgi:hypothetical protein
VEIDEIRRLGERIDKLGQIRSQFDLLPKLTERAYTDMYALRAKTLAGIEQDVSAGDAVLTIVKRNAGRLNKIASRIEVAEREVGAREALVLELLKDPNRLPEEIENQDIDNHLDGLLRSLDRTQSLVHKQLSEINEIASELDRLLSGKPPSLS